MPAIIYPDSAEYEEIIRSARSPRARLFTYGGLVWRKYTDAETGETYLVSVDRAPRPPRSPLDDYDSENDTWVLYDERYG